MADTLRSLAGDRFKAVDVISALHAALTPEEIVLDRYVFMPHARTGIAAALTTPFTWGLPTRGAVDMRVPVIDDRGSLDAEMRVRVYGPADVTEIDPRQVIRTYPKADVVNAEVDDLAHVEFDHPHLPWLFTPAGPDAQGRLVPWITLVLAERRYVDWGARRGTVRLARVRRGQLQPPRGPWGWAHAQVTGAKAATRDVEPTLERRLNESNAAHNLSRLVCPRRLNDHTAYVACVVPTFLAGAQAALGVTPVTTLAPAWGTAPNFAAGDPFVLGPPPAFLSWSFGTAEAGNFESLARKLRPAVAPPGVGRRRVDATQPWPGVALGADAPGSEIVVTGPVVSPTPTENEPDQQWPAEADQQWDAAVTAELVAKLNRPDEQAHAVDPGPPIVGPPLYGSMHARQPRIDTEAPADALQPQWFRELNMNPRNRIVGGLGTRVVQAEQEDLMLAAWNQVIGIEAANRALRFAQLARHVSGSLHRRHLARLTNSAVLSVTERVHAKVVDTPGQSVWATLEASSLPLTVATGAFRRVTRVRGPIVRAAVRSTAERRAAVDALAVRDDRFTTNWVLQYSSPDGIRRLSDVAAARLTPDIAASIAPGVDRDALIAQWRADLAKPAPSDRLTREALAHASPPADADLTAEFVGSLVRRLANTAPTDRQMAADAQSAINGASHAILFRTLVEIAGRFGIRDLQISAADALRLQLQTRVVLRGATRTRVTTDALLAFSNRALEAVQQHDIGAPLADFERTGAELRAITANGIHLDAQTLLRGLEAIGTKAVTDDPFAESARARINEPALGLVAKLDPARTVTARVVARLLGGSGPLKWLRPGWFDDLRVEPVMAHPRFAYPMYEPLHRYDRDWMIPGLGLIQKPDMATLLQTNNRFIEAYLVGLNHEMARELLWREFPTDQRGTYFSSFWTGAPELVADMHEPAWRSGALGTHVDPRLDGQLVFLVRGDLVRRYPGVVAHAVRETGNDGGIPRFEAGTPVTTLFHVHLPPNVLLVGFGMTKDRIFTAGETWWFTLSENPTEPRFGLDPSRDGPITRDNLVWTDFGIGTAGAFLDATKHTEITFEGSRWGASSAQVAYLLFQLPARAAFLGKKMIAGAMPNA